MFDNKEISEVYDRIDDYLRSDDHLPMIVDVPNADILNELNARYSKYFLSVKEYCKYDENLPFEKMLEEVCDRRETTFVVHFSPFLKLKGEEEVRTRLDDIVRCKPLSKTVFISFRCVRYLEELCKDIPRFSKRVVIVPGEHQRIPNIVFTSIDFLGSSTPNTKGGLHLLGERVESSKSTETEIEIATKYSKKNFLHSLYKLRDEKTYYQALGSRIGASSMPAESLGTDENWRDALNLFKEKGYKSWGEALQDRGFKSEVLKDRFGEYFKYGRKDDFNKWLCFIALKLHYTQNGSPLAEATIQSYKMKEVFERLFLSILEHNPAVPGFEEFYKERKELLNKLDIPSDYVNDYFVGKILDVAKKDPMEALKRLTDVTDYERKLVLEIVAKYDLTVKREDLLYVLSIVYPDLHSYLNSRFDFDEQTQSDDFNKFLTEYFQGYKFQKVFNKLDDSFVEKVEEKARDYDTFCCRYLHPLSSRVVEPEKKDCEVIFVDALGVEYLGFIQNLCSEFNLRCKIDVYRCKLPSITEGNKDECLKLFPEFTVTSNKELDDLKHKGSDADSSRTPFPRYISDELRVIRNVLKNARNRLLLSEKKKVYIISDHGASRLAVLYHCPSGKDKIEMEIDGERGGRCCRKGKNEKKPDGVDGIVEENGYWVSANYNLFKGGHKSGYEMHGGATLEEICVPIIELSLSEETTISISIDGSSGNDVMPTFKITTKNKEVNLIVAANRELGDVTLKIERKGEETKSYSGKKEPPEDSMDRRGYKYRFVLTGITKPGEYQIKVYEDGVERECKTKRIKIERGLGEIDKDFFGEK